MTPEVRLVLEEAEAVIVGPSNPIASIGPILAVPGMKEALRGDGGAGRRGQPTGGRQVAEGADRAVHALGRAGDERRWHRHGTTAT